jgi:hypothetical protein
MEAATVEDAVFLAFTFILAIVLTLGILIWGRTFAADRT